MASYLMDDAFINHCSACGRIDPEKKEPEDAYCLRCNTETELAYLREGFPGPYYYIKGPTKADRAIMLEQRAREDPPLFR